MLLSGSFVQAFAEEETVESASVAVPETVSEEDSEDTKEAEEVKEKEEKEKEEATVEKETASSEEETPDSAEETQELQEPAESDKQDKKSEEAEDNKDAEAFTSDKLTFECDEYTVTLEYGKEAGIPEGTVLDVREISSDTDDAKEQKEYEEYYDRSLEQLRSEKGGDTIAKLGFARFYDITLVSGGKEIEPGDDVKVTFKYSKNSRESVKEGNKEGDAIRVIHMMESGKNGEIKAKPIEKKDTDLTLDKKELTEAAFTTDSFSVYGIVYTVDFEYEGYIYSIPGESEIMLSDLFESLHIEESIKDVKNVEFTDYSLIKVERSGEDWKLISLKPFNTEEKLTVTLEDKIIEIKVTDADSNNTFLLYRVRNANEYFKTRLYISRSGGSTTLAGNSGTTVIHDGSEGWMDLETFVKKYDEKYVFPRYSVIAAGDQGDGDRALCAAGFFSTQLTGLHGTAGLYPVTRTVGIFSFEGSASDTKYDIDITLNDNSLPVKVYVDENLEYDDVLIEQSDSKTYTVTELLAVLGYDGYDVKSSKIGTDDVSSVSVEELTGTSLAGKTISRPAVPVTAPPTYYTNAFSYTYPKAYKWTYNSGTAVGDDTLIINLETPIARVSNDGRNTWTYHSYLINNGTQGDGVTKIGAFDQANSLSDDVIIEMLYDAHERYTLVDGYTFNNSDISSLTIKGTDSKSTLVKNQTTAPMITTTGIYTVEFNNIIFDGNEKPTPNNFGGAVLTNAGELTVSGCKFTKCVAGNPGNNKGQGGGFCHQNTNGKVTVTGCDFENCKANGSKDNQGAGGGGFFTDALELSVSNSSFEGCTTYAYQGAGFFHKRLNDTVASKTTVTGCTFTACVSVWSGGGMESDARNVLVENSKFIGCKATSSSGGKGGAINIWANGENDTGKESTFTLSGCTFGGDEAGEGCTANQNAGAVRSTALNTIIENSTFTNCNAAANGGAVACTNNKTIATVTDCTFKNCSAAGNGGAIESGRITLNDITVADCSATGKGGAVHSGQTITMTGGSVTGCRTSGNSAALDADTAVSGLTFSGNIVVEGNTGSGGEARDVYLGTDTDRHIRIAGDGLGADASVGIYVDDANSAFENHGKQGKLFAWTGNNGGREASSFNNLDKFFNDRLENLHGMAAVEGSGNYWKYRIMWPNETPVAPTNVDLQLLPYILILIGGAVLILMKKVSDRRRKTENEGDQDS